MNIIDLDYQFQSGKFSGKTVEEVINSNGGVKYIKWFLPRNNSTLSKQALKLAHKHQKLNLSNDIVNILEKIGSNVSNKLLELTNNDIHTKWSDLKVNSNSPEIVNFKIPMTSKVGQIKITRLIKSIFDLNDIPVTSNELEDFLHDYLEKVNTDINKLIVVSGKDIIKYYNVDNYARRVGTLSSSCMRYSWYSNKIEFYAINNDNIEMLVMLDNNGKVEGRTLLWKNCLVTYPDGKVETKTIMDRIYTCSSKDRSKFINWGLTNGLVVRRDFRAGSNKKFIVGDSEKTLRIKTPELNRIESTMPHLDTLSNEYFTNGKLVLRN